MDTSRKGWLTSFKRRVQADELVHGEIGEFFVGGEGRERDISKDPTEISSPHPVC